MIGLNQKLEKREKDGQPVRIGLLGAGQMGTDVVATTKMMKGIEVVAAVDIVLENAREAYNIAQLDVEVVEVKTAAEADEAVRAGKRVIARDYRIVCDMKTVDVMLDVKISVVLGSALCSLHARTLYLPGPRLLNANLPSASATA